MRSLIHPDLSGFFRDDMAFLRQWWGGEEAAIRNIISRNPWARLRIAASSPPISPQRQCHPERQRGIPR
jgi:hypothetical protein